MCTNFYGGIFMTALTISYLPPFRTLSGELGEDNRLFGVFFLVLLATCLHEECVRCHPATRLCISALSSPHLRCYLIILICILYVGLILLGGTCKERREELKFHTSKSGQYSSQTSRMINYNNSECSFKRSGAMKIFSDSLPFV